MASLISNITTKGVLKYFLLFIIFTSKFSFSLGKNENEKLIIDFLSKSEGEIAILDETHEPYFSQLQHKEVGIMIGEKIPTQKPISEVRDYARTKFSSAVSSFTLSEKSCIKYVVEVTASILNQKELFLFTKQPWKFIKTENWLCGGFAHTRGEYIILSQKHLDYLSSDWQPDMSATEVENIILKMGSLLVHEQFHCMQRIHPEIFDRLYIRDWNFSKVHVKSDPNIESFQLSNPDAPKPEWAFNHNNQMYWARTLINSETDNPVMGEDLMDIVFIIEKDSTSYKVKKDSLAKITTFRFADLAFYSEQFPVSRGLDHPNEISAYMFSEYFIALYKKTTPFSNCTRENKENSIKFVNWLEKELR